MTQRTVGGSHVLFMSARFAVSTIECFPSERDGRLTELSMHPAIVLVRAGWLRRRTLGHLSMVNSTQCYVQCEGGADLIEEVSATPGHRSTVISVHEEAVPPVLRARSRLAPTECRTSPAADLQHRLLLASCRRGADETSISALAEALVARLFDELLDAAHAPGGRLHGSAGRCIVDSTRELLATPLAPDLDSLAAHACVTFPPTLLECSNTARGSRSSSTAIVSGYGSRWNASRMTTVTCAESPTISALRTRHTSLGA